MLLLAEGRNAEEVILVEIVDLALLQARQNQGVLDLLSPLQNVLDREVLHAKLFILHVLQAFNEALLLHLSHSQILLQRLKDANGDSDGGELSFHDDEVENFLEVGVGQGVGEEGDEPLKDPQLIRNVGLS